MSDGWHDIHGQTVAAEGAWAPWKAGERHYVHYNPVLDTVERVSADVTEYGTLTITIEALEYLLGRAGFLREKEEKA